MRKLVSMLVALLLAASMLAVGGAEDFAIGSAPIGDAGDTSDYQIVACPEQGFSTLTAPSLNWYYEELGVYIDLGSVNNYYHKSAKCSDAKFSGGTKVTLQYVLDWKYKACPYCNPPTRVSAEPGEM